VKLPGYVKGSERWLDAESQCNLKHGHLISDKDYITFGRHLIISNMKALNISKAWTGTYYAPPVIRKGK